MIRKTTMTLGALALCALFASAAFAKQITIRGKLQKTVEVNGWVIVTGQQKYLLLNAQKFQNEKWFAEASEVEAIGEIKKGVITIHMEGIPFAVQSMHPVEQHESQVITPVMICLPLASD